MTIPLASSLAVIPFLMIFLAVPLSVFGIFPFLIGRFFLKEKSVQTFFLRILIILLIAISGWTIFITYESVVRAYPVSEIVNVSENNIPQLFIPYIIVQTTLALPVLILSKRLPLVAIALPVILSLINNTMIMNIGNHIFYNIEERHYHFYDKIHLSPTVVGICGTLMLIAYFIGINLQKDKNLSYKSIQFKN